MVSRKRPITEVISFDKISDAAPSAKVYGTVTSVSQMKRGKKQNYFEGSLSDGTTKIRLVGFIPKVQRQLNEIFGDRNPVEIDNCEIKQSLRGDGMEIIMKSDTTVQITTREVNTPPDVDFDDCNSCNDVFAIRAKKKYEFARVSIKAKAVRIGDLETVRTGKQKQEVIVADQTDTIQVTLWEDNVGRLKLGETYYLGNFVVREWGGGKYLAMYAESTIEKVDELRNVVNPSHDEEKILLDAQIVAVTHLTIQKTCIRCGSRVEENIDNSMLMRCSLANCMMLQKTEICNQHKSAKLMFMCNSLFVTLTIQDNILNAMMGLRPITEDSLLSLPPIKRLAYNNRSIITDVEMGPADSASSFTQTGTGPTNSGYDEESSFPQTGSADSGYDGLSLEQTRQTFNEGSSWEWEGSSPELGTDVSVP